MRRGKPAPHTGRQAVTPVTHDSWGKAMQLYDGAGNLINDGYQTMSYDATGQQASASGAGLAQNYDGDRLRVKKVENGTTTYYLRSTVLGGQVVAELNASGTWTRGYVYLGGQMVALQSGQSMLDPTETIPGNRQGAVKPSSRPGKSTL